MLDVCSDLLVDPNKQTTSELNDAKYEILSIPTNFSIPVNCLIYTSINLKNGSPYTCASSYFLLVEVRAQRYILTPIC